eukprot:scpid76748/ scgid22978/ Cytoplasmic phosphatidylinositol transfer protein 1; Retinal degeneration B homolog beta
MVLTQEYRVCLPVSVDEYRIGQLYMIAKHSLEQSDEGDGVEIVKNEPCEDPVHGTGQYTEKHIHISNKLPGWIRPFIPKFIHIIEKAWNYFPYTLTEYECSVVPRFSVKVETRYENNNGSSPNALSVPESGLDRPVHFLDIAHDEVAEKSYKEEEDCRVFKSKKTGRGPLSEKDWKDHVSPVMCSYKLVTATCGIWGVQGKIENKVHEQIREILLLGHRQAFAWIDEWHGMTLDDVREYEKKNE